jgi:hypothetical protein
LALTSIGAFGVPNDLKTQPIEKKQLGMWRESRLQYLLFANGRFFPACCRDGAVAAQGGGVGKRFIVLPL